AARPPGLGNTVDNDGRLQESANPNDIFGLNPGENDNSIRGVRDRIRERIDQGGEGSEYLEDLLDGLENTPEP
ncbi:MAG: hypothetical protein ACLFR0_09385, partial [Alphaproteobacteria bacterium]